MSLSAPATLVLQSQQHEAGKQEGHYTYLACALRVQKEEEYQEVECIEVVRCCVGLGTLTRSIPARRSVQRVLPRFQEIVADTFLSENFLELAVWLLSRL